MAENTEKENDDEWQKTKKKRSHLANFNSDSKSQRQSDRIIPKVFFFISFGR